MPLIPKLVYMLIYFVSCKVACQMYRKKVIGFTVLFTHTHTHTMSLSQHSSMEEHTHDYSKLLNQTQISNMNESLRQSYLCNTFQNIEEKSI